MYEVSALLNPYEECLQELETFRLDRSLCREAMIENLTTEQ